MSTDAPSITINRLATIRVTPEGARLLVEIITDDYRERLELIQAFKDMFPVHCSRYWRPGSRAWSIPRHHSHRLHTYLDLMNVNVEWPGGGDVSPEIDYLASFAAQRKLLIADMEQVWPHVACLSLEQLERLAPSPAQAPRLGDQRQKEVQ